MEREEVNHIDLLYNDLYQFTCSFRLSNIELLMSSVSKFLYLIYINCLMLFPIDAFIFHGY